MDSTTEQLKTEYRQQLITLEQKSVESFDKTVITLSGGALGLSLSFLKDIVAPTGAVQPILLMVACGSWAVSLTFVLFSFWLSAKAMRKTISQLDDGTLDKQRPGGIWDRATGSLTFLGGVTFVFGVALMSYFIYLNIT